MLSFCTGFWSPAIGWRWPDPRVGSIFNRVVSIGSRRFHLAIERERENGGRGDSFVFWDFSRRMTMWHTAETGAWRPTGVFHWARTSVGHWCSMNAGATSAKGSYALWRPFRMAAPKYGPRISLSDFFFLPCFHLVAVFLSFLSFFQSVHLSFFYHVSFYFFSFCYLFIHLFIHFCFIFCGKKEIMLTIVIMKWTTEKAQRNWNNDKSSVCGWQFVLLDLWIRILADSCRFERFSPIRRLRMNPETPESVDLSKLLLPDWRCHWIRQPFFLPPLPPPPLPPPPLPPPPLPPPPLSPSFFFTKLKASFFKYDTGSINNYSCKFLGPIRCRRIQGENVSLDLIRF